MNGGKEDRVSRPEDPSLESFSLVTRGSIGGAIPQNPTRNDGGRVLRKVQEDDGASFASL